MRHITLLTTLVALMLASPAIADHSVEHPEPPVISPPEHHETPVLTPPVVEVPPPIVPPIVQQPVNFQLPTMAKPSTILPTDVSGFHVDSVIRQTPTATAILLAKDPRFQFTGEWIPFALISSSIVPSESEYKLVSFTEDTTKHGRVEHIETAKDQPAFMPTIGATFERLSDSQLKLIDGAVIVRGVSEPVLVSTKLCDECVTARIGGNALALMSAFDKKPTILNLADSSADAVSLYVPAGNGQSHLLKIKPGQIAEAYRLDDTPTSNLVAKKIVVNQRIGPHCGLLVSQCHYVKALRKFNLVASLSKEQYNRVLKTAASLQHMRR